MLCLAFAKGERQHTCGNTANPAPSPFPPAFVVARPFSRSFQKSQRSIVRVREPDWGLPLGLYLFFVGVSGLPPVRGCPGAPCLLFCRLGLVPGRAWFWHSACAVRLFLVLGDRWVRIDLAILGLLAQAIVIEIRNASLDFNCHESAFRKLDLRSVLLRATPFQRSISLAW